MKSLWQRWHEYRRAAHERGNHIRFLPKPGLGVRSTIPACTMALERVVHYLGSTAYETPHATKGTCRDCIDIVRDAVAILNKRFG